MKAEIFGVGSLWIWRISVNGSRFVEPAQFYGRRRDAKRGLIRFLKGMKKGVEVPE